MSKRISNERWLQNQIEMRESIGKRLVIARQTAGETQTSLAAKLGVSYQLIQQWERGTRIPKDETIYRLCCVLNTDPEWIKYGRKGK